MKVSPGFFPLKTLQNPCRAGVTRAERAKARLAAGSEPRMAPLHNSQVGIQRSKSKGTAIVMGKNRCPYLAPSITIESPFVKISGWREGVELYLEVIMRT